MGVLCFALFRICTALTSVTDKAGVPEQARRSCIVFHTFSLFAHTCNPTTREPERLREAKGMNSKVFVARNQLRELRHAAPVYSISKSLPVLCCVEERRTAREFF